MKFKKLACLLLVHLLLITLFSCSSKENATIPLGEQELPDMVLEQAQYTLGMSGEDALIMNAKTMTVYKSEKGTILEDVHFRQDSEDGLEGSCDIATLDEAGEKATLSGNVTIYRQSDNLTINASSIEWDNKEKSLKSTGEVAVSYEDGTQIVAEGFSALLDKNDFEFGKILEGVIK